MWKYDACKGWRKVYLFLVFVPRSHPNRTSSEFILYLFYYFVIIVHILIIVIVIIIITFIINITTTTTTIVIQYIIWFSISVRNNISEEFILICQVDNKWFRGNIHGYIQGERERTSWKLFREAQYFQLLTFAAVV